MHFNKTIEYIIIFLLSIHSFLYSTTVFTDWEGSYSGQTVFSFLTIPVSAKQLGKSLSASPSSMDATDVPNSASGTSFFRSNEFAITHIEWLMGLRKEYAGACFPFLNIGTLGLYSQVFTLGDFDYARDIDEYASDPKSVEFSVGASFSRQIINNKLGIGAVASYIESHLAEENGRAFNCSIDAMYKPFNSLSTQLYACNIGTKVKYNNTPEPQPFQAGLSFIFFPFRINSTYQTDKLDLALSLGVKKSIDAPIQAGGNLDFKFIKQLTLRAGYEHFYGHEFTPGGICGGVTVNIQKYGIDAGWKYQSPDFGSVWGVTIRYEGEEKVPQSANQFYNIAARYYQKKKYNRCIVYAKNALKVNPNMWKAHSLITNAVAEIHRQKGTEIVLIYTGNTQGQFIASPINGILMGGLARQAAVINKLRKDYPVCITIDAGNMITDKTHDLKAKLADDYYKYINYDAVGLGTGEIGFGFTRYCSEIKKSNMKFICTTCYKNICDDIVGFKIISAGKYKIAVLNVIPPSMSKKQGKDTTLLAITNELIGYIKSPKISPCDLKILIVNDSWEVVKHYANNIPSADIIICGSIKRHFNTPIKIGSVNVISAGELGKYVGALYLRFDENKKLISFNNKLIPLTNEITPDSEIELLARQISLKADMEKYGIYPGILKDSQIDGVFTFISDRQGESHIYLKVIKKLAEFPLTYGKKPCFKPRISFKTGRILYLSKIDSLEKVVCLIMNIDGSHKKEIDFGGAVEEASFTPDEKWIYASVLQNEQTDIYRTKPVGGELYPVISWENTSEKDISFSSDGINMLFSSDSGGKRQIYISGINGETPVCITGENAYHYRPLFSPLDKYVAYLSDRNNFHGVLDIWIYERSTGKKIRITRKANVKDFYWLDDKGTILYSCGIKLFDLNTINIFSKKSEKLILAGATKDYSETNPSIIPYTDHKRIIYVREYEKGLKKIFWVNLDGSQDRQLTTSDGNCWLE